MNPTLRSLLDLFDPSLELEHARTIPAAWYWDAELYEAERESVFGNSWQAIGRADQVAAPGQFFTVDLAGEPLLVLRDEVGQLQAFYNVCRHRAARVAQEPHGCAAKLRCRYHGWTYDLSGRLRGTPDFDGVCGFSKEDNSLTPIAVAAWGPLVFVHQGAGPPKLADHLRPFIRRCGDARIEKLKWAARREYVLACNWKVFVDNYLDGGYHINTVHPSLAGVIDYSSYRTEIEGEVSVQMSPLKAAAAGSEDVGKVRSGGMAYYAWVYPNLMLNIYDGIMDTNLVLPEGPKQCRVIFDFYFEDTEGPDRQAFIAESIRVADLVQMEDQSICEQVQRGLGSRAFSVGRFSVKREGPGYHFHQLLAKHLRGEATCQAPKP